MQRREFITLVSGAAASLPFAARAQQAGKVYRIGFLSYRDCGANLDPNGPFRRGLREVGYIEGKNLVLECREAPGGSSTSPTSRSNWFVSKLMS
jgi:putative tryptophan/tyrosine transport system substrate-binding protein